MWGSRHMPHEIRPTHWANLRRAAEVPDGTFVTPLGQHRSCAVLTRG